jgi:TolB-like protein/DNA-binding winged helix-turn-helix (wHTH) protein
MYNGSPSPAGVRMASEPVGVQESIRFGEDCELDLYARRLRRGGRVLKLERIPLEILVLLVERRGQLVTREEIVGRIWGKGVFLDTDNSIRGAVRKIRYVLKDDPEQPRFIQTVTGQGYRFIAPLNAPATAAEASSAQAPATGEERRASFPVHRRWAIAITIVAMVVLAVGFGVWQAHHQTGHQPAGGRLMLAVLPFDNLTGDSGQDYFSDGLTEEMITQLGQLDPQRLGVIARTSVMHYKNTRQPLAQIAHELGVQYVLEGSVRRDSQRIRIAAQLISTQDQTHLWAREYDRQLTDLLSLQGEIAEAIASEIQTTLRSKEERPVVARSGPLSPQTYKAYDLYLQGRYYWNKRTPEGFRQAIESFRQATEQDPAYARAYAGLADSYAMLCGYGLAPAKEVMPKAHAAALKALQLDGSIAEAHTSLAMIAQNYDYDWQTAEKEFRKAIQLNPNYATAHHWYAESLALQGRFDEAFGESERARQLDPLSLIIAADNGAIYYFARQYDRAIERFRTVLQMDPDFTRAHLIIAAYVEKGQFKEALADVEAWRRRAGDVPWILEWEVYVHGRAGNFRHAQSAMQELREATSTRRLDPAQFYIVAYAGMNKKDACLSRLEKAWRDRTNVPVGLKVDPIYDPFRDDPRFQDLLRRANLAQ